MIGNETDALLARSMGTHIGEGSYRECYLLGGVVYKYLIGDFESDDCDTSNEDEYRFATELRNAIGTDDSFIYIPEVALYGDVIAMEYIIGTPAGECYCTRDETCVGGCLSPEDYRMLRHMTGLCDLSWHNVLRDQIGRFVPVDLQA